MLLSVLAQVRGGDFTARMPLEWTGLAGKVADGFNDVIIANQALGTELARVSRVVGQQGELSQRVVLGGSTQGWRESVESVNSLIGALVRPTSEMQRVIGAVADGDLSKKVTADVRGEMLDLKNTINAMVDQLNGFVSEVTRVAREVGTEGKLGQAAAVTIEVGGVWKDLTDNVNLMARSVRSPPAVTSASPPGDHAEADEFAIDFAVIDELHALGEPDGETLLTEIVDQFVRDAEPLLVEVRDAVLAGDADAVRRIAHSLKGSASQLGGQRFASSCGRLEALATAGGLTDGQDHLLEVEAEYQTLRRGLTERLSCGDRQVPVPVRP